MQRLRPREDGAKPGSLPHSLCHPTLTGQWAGHSQAQPRDLAIPSLDLGGYSQLGQQKVVLWLSVCPASRAAQG